VQVYWDGEVWIEFSGDSLPIPNEEGEILYAVTSSSFVQAFPLVNSDGLLQFSGDGRMVVKG
jgi:hypothetical protein